MVRNLILAMALLIGSWGCAVAKPCHEGGDVSWPNPVAGDRQCHQKKTQRGWVNHGKFTQKHLNGKIALEGQFEDGKKHGRWIQYDEKGNRVAERVFENGVEVGASGFNPTPQ